MDIVGVGLRAALRVVFFAGLLGCCNFTSVCVNDGLGYEK